MEKKDKRQRFYKWTFVIYPGDSAPDNYKEIISNWHIPCCLSPIHDSDMNGDESEKKTHQHGFIDFSPVKKSYDEVLEFLAPLNGTVPQRVQSEKGLIRYFVHYDNPEKHQYQICDILSFSGYEYADFFNNDSDEERCCQKLENFIFENKISNLIILNQYLAINQEYDLLKYVRRHTYYATSYMKAMKELVSSGYFEEKKGDS